MSSERLSVVKVRVRDLYAEVKPLVEKLAEELGDREVTFVVREGVNTLEDKLSDLLGVLFTEARVRAFAKRLPYSTDLGPLSWFYCVLLFAIEMVYNFVLREFGSSDLPKFFAALEERDPIIIEFLSRLFADALSTAVEVTQRAKQ